MAAQKRAKQSKKTSSAQIVPLSDRVLVAPVAEEDTKQTDTGIILPQTAEQDSRTGKGKVVAVGEGRRSDDGTVTPPAVEEGDTVLYSSFAADTVDFEGEEYAVVSEGNILAVIRS